MLAEAIMSFNGYGITAESGEVIEINNEKIFLDLYQAGFVKQVDKVTED